MSTDFSLYLIAGLFLGLLVACEALLATRKSRLVGLVLPVGFLGMAAYYLYRGLFVYNPRPTMENGMLMTLGLVSFAVTALTLVAARLIQRRLARRAS